MIKILSLASWRRLAQGSFLALALQLLATGGAWAQCAVTLSLILPSNQAVLKANCGSSNMTSITWTRDAGSTNPAPVVFGPFTFPATLADLNFTTLLTSGTHSYTASGLDASGRPVLAGQAAVVTLSQPILTVAVSNGGSVTSAPAGINACTVAGGINCAFGYDTSTTVVLTATADSSSHTFSSWGGDCSGIAGNTCTVSMATLRNVTANFGAQPIAGACGTVAASATQPAAICNPGTPSAVTGNSSSNTWNWTCAGPSNGSTASCSAPQIVDGACGSANGTTPLSTAPSGTAACRTGNVANLVTGTNTFTWSCNGINGGANVTTCSAPMPPTNGACGSANNTNVASAPTGSAACSAGVSTNPTNPSGTFSWTCNGLAGGTPQSCSAFQISGGACGSSSGGSFSSAPSSGLCNAGTASGVSGTGPFNWTCSSTTGGNSASCSASLSSTNTANCGAGEVFNTGAGDQVLSPLEQALWPASQRALNASGDSGLAIQFVADATKFPFGIVVHIVDETNPGASKQFVVSACAHNFANPINVYGDLLLGRAGTIVLRFGSGSVTDLNSDVPLIAGKTYYINFREWKATGDTSPRGIANTQMWWEHRTDP